MYETVGNYLRLPSDAEAALIAAARDPSPVRGLTHGYYKYPARFSPLFPRAAIKAFTRRGDVVLDPHVGGGTTIVEAVAAGRAAIGVDISTLAEFVSVVKCTVYSEAELDVLDRWGRRTADRIDIHLPSVGLTDYEAMGYYKHLDHPSRWRLRKAIEQALACAIALGKPRLVGFGRCVVLRTAQWALDGRKKQATVDEFRSSLLSYAEKKSRCDKGHILFATAGVRTSFLFRGHP
jgi:DNA methylase